MSGWLLGVHDHLAFFLSEYRKTIAELRRMWALSEVKEINEIVNKSLLMERSLKKEQNDSNGKCKEGGNQ